MFGFLSLEFISKKTPILFTVFSLIYGFLPAIIALILNKKEGGSWKSLNFFTPSLKGVLLSIFIPLVYVFLDFYLQIHLGFRSAPDWTIFGSPTQLILIILIGYLGMSILVFGEEIGWRGYLQKKLFTSFGEIKGVFILGLVWGLWHMPVALKGYNFPNYPYLEAFITYPIACIAFSFIIAYIGFNKYSIFIAAFFHAANNFFKGSLISITEVKNEFNFAIFSTLICVDLILIFGYLYWRKIKKE